MSEASVLRSEHLGPIEWDKQSELSLPFGLPGFESERRMLPVEIPAQRPLVFLQSMEQPHVCFVTLPVNAIDCCYRVNLSEEDRWALLFDADEKLENGVDLLCLALLLPVPGSVQVNLNAPIVINLRNSRCIQSILAAPLPRYYTLGSVGWEAVC